jgi:hypothetical protein
MPNSLILTFCKTYQDTCEFFLYLAFQTFDKRKYFEILSQISELIYTQDVLEYTDKNNHKTYYRYFFLVQH